jgi:hypothetical protein
MGWNAASSMIETARQDDRGGEAACLVVAILTGVIV